MRIFYSKAILLILLSIVMGPHSFAQVSAGDAKKIATQRTIDEKKLQEYFAKTHIKPLKTSFGVYYTISKEGEGNKVLAGETVSVFYTGRLLDGTVFDSNIDPSFHHTEPLIFETGKGQVIRGYDKGVQLLKKGSKATLYIPSELAYGEHSPAGIAANSVLVFDVEILDVHR